METSVQQSPSAFRELRQAAGYKTVTALAQELGLPRRTVASWDTGRYVPKWPNVQKIAKAFRVEQVQCFNKLRNESIEDALSCGCQGRKVSPKHDGARCLSVEIPCKNCRKVRTYEQGHSTHRELCKRCAAKLRHPTDFTPYRCVGDHYGKSAPNCLGTRKSGHRKGELRLRNYKNKENLTPEQRSSGKIPWIDESAHEYLCPHCSTAAQKRAEIDEAIIAVVTSKQTQATEEPRVKDPAVRRSLLTKYWNDDEFSFVLKGKGKRFERGEGGRKGQNSFATEGPKRLKRRKPLTAEQFAERRLGALRKAQAKEEVRRNHVIGRMIWEWAGKTAQPERPLPKSYNFARCRGSESSDSFVPCKKPINIQRAPRLALFHGDHYTNFCRTEEGKAYLENLGNAGQLKRLDQLAGKRKYLPRCDEDGPAEAETLKRNFAWVMQRIRGKTCEEIAAAYGTHYTTVKDAANDFAINLSPILLQKQFQTRFWRLKEIYSMLFLRKQKLPLTHI